MNGSKWFGSLFICWHKCKGSCDRVKFWRYGSAGGVLIFGQHLEWTR